MYSVTIVSGKELSASCGVLWPLDPYYEWNPIVGPVVDFPALNSIEKNYIEMDIFLKGSSFGKQNKYSRVWNKHRVHLSIL